MKYVILVGDGLGDYPRPELGGQTPLAAARTPNLDALAKTSLVGRAQTIPPGMEPGSDVANMSLLGYDPLAHHTGRAPLEAASLGLDLSPDEVAFRCNLVVLSEDGAGQMTMTDYCSGHISTPQARPLIEALQKALGSAAFGFHLGTSYRHVLVWTKGRADIPLTPPHDLSGQVVNAHLERLKKDAAVLYELTRRSWDVLASLTPEKRLKVEPTSIWLWGQGRPPKLTPIPERFGLRGAVISAVDLLKGLAVYAGLKPVAVPGASGWLDTNYAGKVRAGLRILAEDDLLYLHVEAPDEAGHSGLLAHKLQAIEDFDAHVVGPLLHGLAPARPFRLLVACDHYTPLSVMTHTPEPVPMMLYDSRRPLGRAEAFSEAQAAKGPYLGPAHLMIERLLERD